jgi:hypothetical protein
MQLNRVAEDKCLVEEKGAARGLYSLDDTIF